VRSRSGRRSVVITSLVGSRAEDIRDRERRYIAAMLFRVVCLVAAVLLFSGPLQVAGIVIAVIMPWLAVMFANQPRAHAPAPSLTVEEAVPRERGLTAGRGSRVIDAD
jgi:predicted MFS family arabinose efflux permease